MSQLLDAIVATTWKGKKEALQPFLGEFGATAVVPKESPLTTLSGLLFSIHPSWIEPVFRKIPEPLRRYVSSLISQNKEDRSLTNPLLQSFFRQWLFDQVCSDGILPFSLVPPPVLDGLLGASKEKLVALIDLLGIQDVALDMRRVLDRADVEKLKKLLSESQRQYLAHCAQENIVPLQHERLIGFWLQHKDPRLLIHSAGLWRLTRIVAAEGPSWVWYLTRRLDMGRGQQMEKWIAQDGKIALQGKPHQVLLDQILKLMAAIQ